jgi:hypothetical protein
MMLAQPLKICGKATYPFPVNIAKTSCGVQASKTVEMRIAYKIRVSLLLAHRSRGAVEIKLHGIYSPSSR